MTETRKANEIVAPAGMSGIACEPWTPGEVYAVAANWAEASSAVLVYGQDGWTHDEHGRQVADFRHNDRDALESVIREAIEMGGDEPDDDEIAAIVTDAVDIRSHELGEMVDVLEQHGDRWTGNCVDDEAQDWLDHDFEADGVNEWCEIGVWDAATAAAFRAAGKTPVQIAAASQSLIDAEEDPAEVYTDGDPIYAVCNSDLDAQIIIDACD